MEFPKIDMERTGRNIKRIMKEKGYSAKILAEKMGFFDKSVVYKWIRGETIPSIDNLFRLSFLFGMSMNDILVTE